MESFDVEALESCPETGPVTMVNLIKFLDASRDGNGSGRDAYKRYLAVADGLVKGVGGSVRWAGKVQHAALCEGDVSWDRVLLVTYPNRAAFLEMINNPAYQKANIDRRNGVEKHVILASATVFEAPAPGVA